MNNLKLKYLLFLLIALQDSTHQSTNWSKINLPKNQMPFYFNSNRLTRRKCLNDPNCPFRSEAESVKCWGYEKNCNETDKKRLFLPQCPEDSKGWVNFTIIYTVTVYRILHVS